MDYTDNERLKQEISHSYVRHGSINMVVAWIHGTAPRAIPTIMKQVSELQENKQWTFVIIKSSGNLDRIITPVKSTERNCIIKEVQLGFIYNENTSRWLTHEEISRGTIQAIKGNKNKTIVGTLTPWNQRP
ncbi:short-chain dehydrogenase [Pseudogracilibacillus sp. SO30301A]|uniref:short-chain dehydrogenase n=1 Tax=Pseudogracilibacillus sp. SO30301A TaxID=3098291 RepID=UPI00300DFE0C